MSTKWTDQQNTAITDRGRSVIVSAAAGSGKTAVLVERLLQILSDSDVQTRINAEDIVVVTFTNDAAAQMKQRLYTAMTEKMNQLSDADADTYSWLLRQQAALGNAKISTINAFCFDLIRENADSCQIAAQFRIAEPAEEFVFVRHAMQTVLERWSKERSTDMETLFSFFCTKNDEELETVILAVAEYMKSLAFADEWAERALKACKDDTILFEANRHAVCEQLEQVLALARKSVPFADAALPAGKKNPFSEKAAEDITNLQFHLNFLQTVPMQKLLENPLVHEVKFVNMSRTKKDVDEEQKAVFQQFQELYKKKYQKAVKSYLQPLHYFAEDAEIQRTIIPLLLGVTQDFRHEMLAEKRRRNTLCFDDGERLALELLGEMQEDGSIVRTELAESLAQRYRIVMVDEYQDCNNKQDCLFKLLSNGCTSDENGLHYGKNAFLVGDVKQSIYSFRQANPKNFIRALDDSIPLAEAGSGETARLYLNRNFRSSEGVIDFVNALFAALMTKQCGEVEYTEDEYLYYGASHYTGAPYAKTTCLLTGGEDPEADTQAECVAEQIAQMIQEKVPVTLRSGEVRPCCYEDFCILLRSVSKDGDAFLKALRDRGIPAAGEEKQDFMLRPEIRLIRNYLQLLDNPLTDVAAAGVMLSPIYGFTAQDLLHLKTNSKQKRLYLQMQELVKKKETTDYSPEILSLCRRCREFTDVVSRLREAVDAMPLEDLIMRIYDETDMLSLQSLYEDASQRRENLQAFIRLAQDYRKHADLTAQSGVSGWLRYLESIEDKPLDIGALPAESKHCVSIKTIHKSKGLEYPFIFVAHMENQFSNKPTKAQLHTAGNGLVGLRLIDRDKYRKSKTAAYQFLVADILRRQRSEEMRLFYVALTRAQQQLFLTMDRGECMRFCLGTCNQKGKEEKQLMMAMLLTACPEAAAALAADAKCMQDWVLQYLLSGSEAPHFLTALEHGKALSSQKVDYICCDAKQVEAAEEEPQKQLLADLPPADSETLDLMQRQLAFQCRTQQSELISKYSVTALSHPELEMAGKLAVPSFMKETKTGKPRVLRGASKGTAVHKMMQYMDFTKAQSDPETELKRMQDEGYLTALEAETLTIEQLKNFFASDLFKRIAASADVCKEEQIFAKIGELALPEDSELYRKYADTDGIVIGTMDLLFREGNGWILVDYKTDYVKKPEELTKKYSVQLALYQKAAELIKQEPVREAYIYSFALDCAIAVDLEKVEFKLEDMYEDNSEAAY